MTRPDIASHGRARAYSDATVERNYVATDAARDQHIAMHDQHVASHMPADYEAAATDVDVIVHGAIDGDRPVD